MISYFHVNNFVIFYFLLILQSLTKLELNLFSLKLNYLSSDGNPVTGTGYTGDTENNGGAPVQNGNGNVAEKVNGSSSPPAPAAQPRTRVPPGGYSSGLW